MHQLVIYTSTLLIKLIALTSKVELILANYQNKAHVVRKWWRIMGIAEQDVGEFDELKCTQMIKV